MLIRCLIEPVLLLIEICGLTIAVHVKKFLLLLAAKLLNFAYFCHLLLPIVLADGRFAK